MTEVDGESEYCIEGAGSIRLGNQLRCKILTAFDLQVMPGIMTPLGLPVNHPCVNNRVNGTLQKLNASVQKLRAGTFASRKSFCCGDKVVVEA